MKSKLVSSLLIVFLLSTAFLAACAPASPGELSSATTQLTPTRTLEATYTPVIASGSLRSGTITVSPTVEPTDEGPLVIDFPTPSSNSLPAWRPPLQPVPWALGPHDHFYFVRAISVDEVNWPLADYRYGYIFPGGDAIHTGIDIDAPTGTPIHATAGGRVTWVGFGLMSGTYDSSDPYGQAVVIRHEFGFNGRRLITVYAHMEETNVVVGQTVEVGDILGWVGNTGNTTGPHLHFEVRLENLNGGFTTRNPELWITPPAGYGLLVGRMMNSNGSLLSSMAVAVQDRYGNLWNINTYAPQVVTGDDYYRENMVLGDLPEGTYWISFDYNEERIVQRVEIHNGAITYFTFQGIYGFSFDLPPDGDIDTWLVTPIP
ncbi:MAG TPA: M23 family metallopeptidase [Longilinea sp.]|nr:M23 family metallopeptidase [Longilinea sp.]